MQPSLPSSPRPLWKRALPFLLVGGAANAVAARPLLGGLVAVVLLVVAFLAGTGRLPRVRSRRAVAWLGGAGALTAFLSVATCASSPGDTPRGSAPSSVASAVVPMPIPMATPIAGSAPSAAVPEVASTARSPISDVVATWAAARDPLPGVSERASLDVAYVAGDQLVDVDRRRRASLDDGTLVRVVGRTNLPDTTRLIVQLDGPTFSGQSRGEVVAGTFTAGPFGPSSGAQGGNELPPGTYSVTVTIHVSQPEAVRAVVGASGERLRGALVRQTSFGRVVEWSGSLAIAGVRPQQFRGGESVRRVERLISEGRALDGVRQRIDDDLGAANTCGVRMRAMLVEVEELRTEVARAPAIGNRDALRVRGALGNLAACVTCASNAMRNCALAEDAVNER